MKTNHNFYLDLAFQIAKKNLGNTGLNPVVGTLVVKNNTVLSSGVTSIKGRPHSEYIALNGISNCSGATLYTTLEPCTHYGKTPPCTNLIIQKKIKKVYYAFDDPDERTFKKAKKILSAKGIQVKLLKSEKNIDFYKSYFLNKKLNIPFITGKIAISKDFFTINKKNKWITNCASRKLSHLLRYKNDCIISTSRSINLDNSLLNCRIDGLNKNKPDLFIIDLHVKLKKNILLNKFINKRKTYLVINKKNLRKTKIFKKKGYKIVTVDSLKSKQDFFLLYKKIFKLGYSRAFVETGLTFLNTLIKNRLIHNLYIFQNNKKLGKYGKNNANSKYLKKISSKLITINLNDDKLYKKEF